MNRALVTSSRYSPGNMSAEALEKLFVGRSALLDDVLRRVERSATRGEKHFVLLVGPRGVGKTHFISLLAHRLETAPQFANARKKLRVAHLNEEEWGVASFLDLLVRVLQALAAGSKDRKLSKRIEEVYAAFSKAPDAALATAERLLIETVGDHVLLLLCENLTDLFEGLGEEGQKRWRSFIQEHPFWVIVATAPALFGAVSLQSSPFYNFFTIRSLERLGLDDAIDLLGRKARLEGRHDLADFLGTPLGRARMRAIHHLAGGNHRVYVILSDFLDKESLDDLVAPFLRMVDDLTPYYQDRMRQLAPAQRKIVEFLCREGRPVIVKNIASRCLMSQQTAAKQLGELARQQFVISAKHGRETYYELAEPLMRICIDVKDNRTKHLRLFVVFLRHWFSSRELHMRLDALENQVPCTRVVDRLHFAAAVEDYKKHPEEPFLKSLNEEGARCWEQHDMLGALTVGERLVRERGCACDYCNLGSVLRVLERHDEALNALESGLKTHPDDSQLRASHAFQLSEMGRYSEALHEVDRALSLDSTNLIARETRSEILYALKRGDDARENDDRLVAVAKDPWLKAHALRRLGRHSEALRILDQALKQHPESERLLCVRGTILSEMRRYEDLLVNEDRMLSFHPNHEHSIYNKAVASFGLERYDDAVRLARDFVGCHPERSHGWPVLFLAEARAIGLNAAIESIEAFLSAGAVGDVREALDGVVAGLLIVATENSLSDLVRHVASLRDVLTKHNHTEALAAGLVALLRHFAKHRELVSSEWIPATETLSTTLSDLPECQFPIQMLSVLARYEQSKDETLLLELPLEQRALLLATDDLAS
jgi:tetratricopeptide (TPR) repeat protein